MEHTSSQFPLPSSVSHVVKHRTSHSLHDTKTVTESETPFTPTPESEAAHIEWVVGQGTQGVRVAQHHRNSGTWQTVVTVR